MLLKLFRPILIFLTLSGAAGATDPQPRLCHIANAGFFITDGSTGVLIDALMDEGLPNYALPSARLEAAMERGEVPFDSVGLVIATHIHRDHFNPEPFIRHMAANPGTTYIVTPQAAAELEAAGIPPSGSGRIVALHPGPGDAARFRIGDLDIEVYRAVHGGPSELENLGVRISVNGRMIQYHNAVLEKRRSDGADLPEHGPADYLLTGYWPLLEPDSTALLTANYTFRHIVPMHFSPPRVERQWMARHGGPAGVVEKALAALPNTISLLGEMACVKF